MSSKRSFRQRFFLCGLCAFFLVVMAFVAALLHINPKPLSEKDARAITADQARIEAFISRGREAVKKSAPTNPDSRDTTAVLQARCDQTYHDLIAAIDRLGSRSQLTTDTQARAEILRLARELGTYYDNRMTISRSARIHQPKHVQILYDVGRIIMSDGGKQSMLTRFGIQDWSPEYRKQMLEAEPLDKLKTNFEQAAKMYYVLDPAAPFSLEYHDSSFGGDHPVMHATDNLLALYGSDPDHFGPLLKAIDPELVARRRPPDLAPILNELIESSAWLSQQYYDHTATWDQATALFEPHLEGQVAAKQMQTVLNGEMLWQLWNRNELLVKQNEWLAELSTRADSIHNWNDLQSPTRPRTDPDMVMGDEVMTNALNQIQQSRLQAAALEIIQGKPIPNKASPDSYFYNCFSRNDIRLIPAVDRATGAKVIGLSSCTLWKTARPHEFNTQSNGEVWLRLPPDHPALKSVR